MKPNDLTGMKFNRWTVISRAENRSGKTRFLCRCDCGTERVLYGYSLKAKVGGSKSCGCYEKDNPSALTHGGRNTRLYGIWVGMKTRCYNKKWHAYKRYGGRGIKVCDEWLHNFEAFSLWAVENGYGDELTIERKNNDFGYSPSNCKWIKQLDQSRNRSSNKLDRKKVIDIKKMLSEGKKSNKEIAVSYSVCVSTIQKIKSGLLWANV